MTEDEKSSCELIRRELKDRGLISVEDFDALCHKHGVDPKIAKMYMLASAL